MKSLTYLFINIAAVIICFAFSYHSKIRFNKSFKAFFVSCSLIAIPFIIWDIWFTSRREWWFDYSYTIGISIFGLPVEELLFFFCIPFSCIFTYYCITSFYSLCWLKPYANIITIAISAICISGFWVFQERIYTSITSLITLMAVSVMWIAKRNVLVAKSAFCYILLLPGFFAVNGVLTGSGLDSPVVNYSPHAITGLRVFTIPIEDFMYGYLLILLNITLFEFFSGKSKLRS